jgi:hypothetical protein
MRVSLSLLLLLAFASATVLSRTHTAAIHLA